MDFRELAGLRTVEMVQRDTYPVMICEGCGLTLVDEDGRCVDRGCRLHGDQPESDVADALLDIEGVPV